MHLQNSNNIYFNPLELLQNHLSKNYDLLSEQLIHILNHFDQVIYLELVSESHYFINTLVKKFFTCIYSTRLFVKRSLCQ